MACNRTYNANREDTVAVLAFGQPTVKGLNTIVPPQQNPAHVFAIGDVIEMIASYPFGSDTFIGSAIPNVIFCSVAVYDDKHSFVDESQTTFESTWAYTGRLLARCGFI